MAKRHDKTGIYSIRNLINGKRYIGRSKNIYSRWTAHRHALNRQSANNSNIYLLNAWNKYGIELFKFEVIEECSIEVYVEREQYWIDFYNSHDSNFGYNIASDKYIKIPKTHNIIKPSGRSIVNKGIFQIDSVTNQVIRFYYSYTEAMEYLGITYLKFRKIWLGANISKTQGRRTSYKKDYWVREFEYDPNFDYRTLNPPKRKRGVKHSKSNYRPIIKENQ